MKRFLVTGATGFIGNHLVNALLNEGHEVVATSRDSDRASRFEWFNRVYYVPFDIGQIQRHQNYFDFFQNPDIVIHLAWEGLPNYKSDFHVNVNLPRHKQFLSMLIDQGCKHLLVAGTCLEYGVRDGEMKEDDVIVPATSYAIAKNELREYLEKYVCNKNVCLQWVRFFYMYGKGQAATSLLPQLDKALSEGQANFRMSGGQQIRDYLNISEVASYVGKISLQTKVNGVINCCSGKGVKLLDFVNEYLSKNTNKINLELGYYPYSDYEAMSFWGSNTKLNQILEMENPVKLFSQECDQRIKSNGQNQGLLKAAEIFNTESNKAQYSYNFSWMGRPIIQYPQDMLAMQELIWKIQPDLIIETGIAHGGSLIYYASILELIGKGEVLGIDIDIREHNRAEIEKHPMFKRISMIEGSSISPETVEKVSKFTEAKKNILVCLDSNHTHEHVQQELELYAPFVSLESYLVVFDTIVEDLPEGYFNQPRPWGKGNNPKTAVWEFIKKNQCFEIDSAIDHKLLISVAPSGYLKRIK